MKETMTSQAIRNEPWHIFAGWWYTYPSEKLESQWEGLSHISWKNGWNHQPVWVFGTYIMVIWYGFSQHHEDIEPTIHPLCMTVCFEHVAYPPWNFCFRKSDDQLFQFWASYEFWNKPMFKIPHQFFCTRELYRVRLYPYEINNLIIPKTTQNPSHRKAATQFEVLPPNLRSLQICFALLPQREREKRLLQRNSLRKACRVGETLNTDGFSFARANYFRECLEPCWWFLVWTIMKQIWTNTSVRYDFSTMSSWKCADSRFLMLSWALCPSQCRAWARLYKAFSLPSTDAEQIPGGGGIPSSRCLVI